jgi:hypothetical protein
MVDYPQGAAGVQCHTEVFIFAHFQVGAPGAEAQGTFAHGVFALRLFPLEFSAKQGYI